MISVSNGYDEQQRRPVNVAEGCHGHGCVEGPSRLTGEPVVAILTGENGARRPTTPRRAKWSNCGSWTPTVDPNEANRTGADEANCGQCPIKKICYVPVVQAPNQIWKSYKRGSYAKATTLDMKRALAGRKLRLGAYGDPMSLPIGLIRKLTSFATGHTGYTHSWRLPWSQPYRKFIMASVESESAAAHAHAKGFRTFRVRRDDQPVMPTEIICPASDEAGHKRTCETCLACDGRRRDGQRSVTIIIHGGIQVQRDPRKAFDAIAS